MHLEGGEGSQGYSAACYILSPLRKASVDHLEDFASRLTPDFLKPQSSPPLKKFSEYITDYVIPHNTADFSKDIPAGKLLVVAGVATT